MATYGGGMPAIDFSTLGELGNVYQAAKRQAGRERVLAGGGSPETMARELLQYDPEGGMSLMRLAEMQAQHRQAQARQAEEFAFRKQEAGRQAGQWQQSFGLQQQAAERANMTEAQKEARDLGLQPGTPQHTAYMQQRYKMGDTGQITSVTNPATGEKEDVIYNSRLSPEQQFRPIPSTAFAQPPAAADGAPPAPLPPRTGPKAFEPAMNLRKEVTSLPETKRISEALPIFHSMVESHTKDTAAADLDFVYGMAKIFDPDSVVREGEMKLIGQAKSLPEDIQGWMKKVAFGEARLPVKVRERLLEVAQTRMGQLHSAYQQRLEPYRGIAQRHRVNPEDILPQLAPAPKWQKSETKIPDPPPGFHVVMP